jgi:hypothetical protein
VTAYDSHPMPLTCPHCSLTSERHADLGDGLRRCRQCGLTFGMESDARGVEPQRDAPDLGVQPPDPDLPDPRPWRPAGDPSDHWRFVRASRSFTLGLLASVTFMGALAFGLAWAFDRVTPTEPPPLRLELYAVATPRSSNAPPPTPVDVPSDVADSSTTVEPAPAPSPDEPVPTPKPTPVPTPVPEPPQPDVPIAPEPPPGTVTPPSPPPPAPNPTPAPTPVPGPAGPALASTARIELKCNAPVYAATEVAAYAVELERLKLAPAAWGQRVQSTMIDPSADALRRYGRPDLASVAEMTLPASWSCAAPWLHEQRPPFAINLLGVPEGTEVEIAIEVPNPAHRRLLAPGQATSSARLVLRSGVPEVIRFGAADDWQVFLSPRWERRALGNLLQREDIDFEVRVRFPADGSQFPAISHRATVFPITDVQLRYPCFISAMAHVNASHPHLDEIRARITNGPIAKKLQINLGGSADFREVFLWFREFQLMRLNYESSALAAITKRSQDPIQRIRPIHKTLKEASGNCADLTVLMASALSSSFETFIMLPPGHAFVAYPDSTLGRLIGLECTALGREDITRGMGREQRRMLDMKVKSLISGSREIGALRQALGNADEEIFDLFLVAIITGTEALDEAAQQAAAGSSAGARPLAQLDQERKQLEAQLAATPDPAQQRRLMDQLELVNTEASWGHLLPIFIPAAHAIGAEHAEPDQATLGAYSLPPAPKPRRR